MKEEKNTHNNNNNNNNPVDNSLPTLIFLHALSTVVMINLKPKLTVTFFP